MKKELKLKYARSSRLDYERKSNFLCQNDEFLVIATTSPQTVSIFVNDDVGESFNSLLYC